MLINVLYEGDFDDCDIISVPDFVGCDIEDYGQQFCNWLNSNLLSDEWYITIDNHRVTVLETEGFVKWLNDNICSKDEKQLAYIVKQHTKLVNEYPIVEF